MELVITIIVAVVSGVGSGVLAAVLTPGAQRRAEETREKQTRRRALVSAGRELVAEARGLGWTYDDVSSEERYMDLRPHLPQAVQQMYSVKGTTHHRTVYVAKPTHGELLDAIDALEKQWNLV